jgi:hypothetical protein
MPRIRASLAGKARWVVHLSIAACKYNINLRFLRASHGTKWAGVSHFSLRARAVAAASEGTFEILENCLNYTLLVNPTRAVSCYREPINIKTATETWNCRFWSFHFSFIVGKTRGPALQLLRKEGNIITLQ